LIKKIKCFFEKGKERKRERRVATFERVLGFWAFKKMMV
jgi:hypothetical protein